MRSDGLFFAPMLPSPPEIVTCHGCRALFVLNEAREVGQVDPFNEDDSPAEWRTAEPLHEPDFARCLKALGGDVRHDLADEKVLRRLCWRKSNDLVALGSASSLKVMAWIGGAIGLLSLLLWVDIGLGLVGLHQSANPPATALVMTGLAAAMISAAWVLPPRGWFFVQNDRGGSATGFEVLRIANMEALTALCDPNDQGERLMLAELLRQLGRFDESVHLLAAQLPAELAWVGVEIDALCQASDRQPRWLRTPKK
jgi:hypothetical protein